MVIDLQTLIGGEVEKNKELAKWLFEYQKTGDKAATMALLNDFDTKMTKRKRVAQHIYEANYTDAQTLLDGLTETSEEEIRFKEYHQLLVNLGQNGHSIFEIDAAQETQLMDIANSKTKTAYRAQTALYLAKGIETSVTMPTMSTANSSNWFTVFKQGSGFVNISSIHPNPATQKAVFDYTLEDGQMIQFKVFNATGILVEEAVLEGIGNYEMNIEKYADGLHLCMFIDDTGVLHRDKFIVVK